MAADVGTLQRLPKVIGSRSLVNELCLTGRKVQAAEAKDCGLVSKVFDSTERFVYFMIGNEAVCNNLATG
jgi:delta(3,5)-delta(2,4)-dienoyl-CoA isomerase